MRKTSRRSSGVLTAKRNLPLGDSARGRTWPLSKSVKCPERSVLKSDPRSADPVGSAAARQARTDNRATTDKTKRRARYGIAIEPPSRRYVRRSLNLSGGEREDSSEESRSNGLSKFS